MRMSFDEFIQLKGLEFKASLAGKSSGAQLFLGDALEQLGSKNICFRVDPVTQARFETTIEALSLSKQEALLEMLWEMLNRIDEQLERIGVGKIGYEARLRELGYVLGEPDKDGKSSIERIKQTSQGGER